MFAAFDHPGTLYTALKVRGDASRGVEALCVALLLCSLLAAMAFMCHRSRQEHLARRANLRARTAAGGNAGGGDAGGKAAGGNGAGGSGAMGLGSSKTASSDDVIEPYDPTRMEPLRDDKAGRALPAAARGAAREGLGRPDGKGRLSFGRGGATAAETDGSTRESSAQRGSIDVCISTRGSSAQRPSKHDHLGERSNPRVETQMSRIMQERSGGRPQMEARCAQI